MLSLLVTFLAVLCSIGVAALAERRRRMSRSANRMLYAALVIIAALTGLLNIGAIWIDDMVLSSLLAYPGFAIAILWVVLRKLAARLPASET